MRYHGGYGGRNLPHGGHRNSFSVSADSPSDSLPQVSDIEVDQESYSLSTEFEIRQQLRFVHRQNRLDRFDLDENFIFDNEINPVPEIDHDVVIHNGIRFFYLEPHPETP